MQTFLTRFYLNEIRKKGTLDKTALLVGIVGPFASIPQLLTIWNSRSVESLSAGSFGAYSLFSFVWVLYGIKHKEFAIYFSNILWFIANFLIFTACIIFK